MYQALFLHAGYRLRYTEINACLEILASAKKMVVVLGLEGGRTSQNPF